MKRLKFFFFGLEIVISIFFFTFIGILIDNYFEFNYFFIFIGFFIGFSLFIKILVNIINEYRKS